MKKEEKSGNMGATAFTIGIVIALIAGFLPANLGGIIVAVLVVLGIAVGIMNVTDEETSKFLMASVSIMIALFTAGSAIQSNIATLGIIGKYLWGVMSNINIFVFPATIVVAIKAVYALARD
ncbi:hypothetical protein J4460_06045 [Candidatus Woesearchaeota archaeon]|nr:hypothetical protein [Candidatus Woesearchaeota archaeon]HIH37561.1 hypothetical protein [Candidatus Woesearchaeota archaeon]HIH47974.1 hypothetical protein [Candidatus Woesearchaeota archaeon]HIJ03698.1 hypothetical protein [Candidatus Woesearchaeota archaeon]